jgi:hypothetical protein
MDRYSRRNRLFETSSPVSTPSAASAVRITAGLLAHGGNDRDGELSVTFRRLVRLRSDFADFAANLIRKN